LSFNVGALTQQFSVISAREIDPKKVCWDDIVAGDRLSMKPGKSGQMVKSVATICSMDNMSLSME
jgi:hypothetical protein